MELNPTHVGLKETQIWTFQGAPFHFSLVCNDQIVSYTVSLLTQVNDK